MIFLAGLFCFVLLCVLIVKLYFKIMYHIYNVDEMKVKKVHKSELFGTLKDLEEKGAVFSLDIDDEITYSFDDDFEGESIETLIEKAPYH